ncbi:hypothetical protein FRC0103_02150 [Corynebacterium diphtheriae]|nr:hypothetical protein FRC0103_02150 [Corynebacterium diphtheriae]
MRLFPPPLPRTIATRVLRAVGGTPCTGALYRYTKRGCGLLLPAVPKIKNLVGQKNHTLSMKSGQSSRFKALTSTTLGLSSAPSVQYHAGEIVFVPEESHNPNVRAKRTLSDGSKKPFAEDLLRNQLNVLMTPRCPRCLSRLRAPTLQSTTGFGTSTGLVI